MRESENISLTPEQAALVENQVRSGRYESAGEVVRAGLRLLEEHELRLHELRTGIQRGADDLDAGRLVDGPEILKELQDKHERHGPNTAKKTA